MGEKNYKKKVEFQRKIIDRQLNQIHSLQSKIEELCLECEQKDKEIQFVKELKAKLESDISDIKRYKEEYRILIEDLKKMKDAMNQIVYKNRWNIVKLLIK